MGDSTREWMEGKLYRYDLEHEQLLRIIDGYDWGFYPMNGGVAVYTDATSPTTTPSVAASAPCTPLKLTPCSSGGGDAVIIYDADRRDRYLRLCRRHHCRRQRWPARLCRPRDHPPRRRKWGLENLQPQVKAARPSTSGGSDWYEQNRPSGNGSGSGSGDSHDVPRLHGKRTAEPAPHAALVAPCLPL